MAHIPASLNQDPTSEYLKSKGYEMIHQGKVRDTFKIHDGELLAVATDRISIYEFVLNTKVPFKGACLTTLTHFWMTKILTELKNHLIPSVINPKYNAAYDLRENLLTGLNIRNCLVVQDLRGFMDLAELIFRKCFGGSVYDLYLETGEAAGVVVPLGLIKWQELPNALFTPTTKEAIGHDLPMTQKEYYDITGNKGREFVKKLQAAFVTVQNHIASKGMIMLDTKLEGSSRLGILADECFTPDSSRICMRKDYEEAMAENRNPRFKDKQFVREWGSKVPTPWGIGINNLSPENPDHLAFVDTLTVPKDVVMRTSFEYKDIVERVTGRELERYQRSAMGV